ncbi:TolC family protein [Salinispirillum sp. LH 10-3-1]|uniref:TolC family protein n=1 Tax=Salinispirillum sp. LH 10-3-1 TaxID=2952525 RepID=A0AB38YHY3_9GAMM
MAVAESVQRALEFHPDVRVKMHGLAAAMSDRREAWGSYLPTVDFNTSAGIELQTNDDRDLYDIFSGDLTVTQMLYRGFRTRNEVERLGHIGVVRYFELLESVNRVTYETVVAYEDVIRTRRLLALAEESRELNRRVREQIESRVNSGAAPRVELEQMNGRLALAESNLLVETANLHDAIVRYRRLTGQMPGENMPVSFFDPKIVPDDIRGALHKAYQSNPRFQSAVANVSVAASAADVQRASFHPEVFLRARQNVGRNQGGFDSRVEDFGGRTGVEVVLSYNLYRGGADAAALSGALDRVEASRDRREDACLDLRQQTQVQFNDQQRLRDQLASLRQHRSSADYVRLAYRDQFDIGQRSLMEVLDIETEYLDASKALVNGEHDYNIAVAGTLNSMGTLMPELGVMARTLPTLDALGLTPPGSDSPVMCTQLDPMDAMAFMPAAQTEFELPDFTTQDMPPAEPVVVVPALVLTSTTSFDMGSVTLSAAGREFLGQLAQQINTMSEIESVTISGYTDSTGPDRVNREISQARADAAREYLSSLGVAADVITAIGYGPDSPVADNSTPEGRAANRRIVVEVRGRD